MNLNLRKSMYITLCISTILLVLGVLIFKDISPKIVVGYAMGYFIFVAVFIIYLIVVLISEAKNIKLNYIKENFLTFLVGILVTTLIFYGMDYLFTPEKLSISRALFKGIEGAIAILIAKVMLKDTKQRKRE